MKVKLNIKRMEMQKSGLVEWVNNSIRSLIEIVIFVWLTYPDVFYKPVSYPVRHVRQLLNAGLITDEDYEKKKNEILFKGDS